MERPEKGTPEYDLWIAAIEVAVYPAEKHGSQYSAQVAWHLIEDLRKAIEGIGIDWRAVLRETHKRRRESMLRADRESGS